MGYSAQIQTDMPIRANQVRYGGKIVGPLGICNLNGPKKCAVEKFEHSSNVLPFGIEDLWETPNRLEGAFRSSRNPPFIRKL